MAIDWGSSPVLLIYTVAHLLAAILSLVLTGYIVRNYWEKPIGRMFTALVAATSIGVIGTLARLFTTSLDAFVALTVLKYVGIGTAPIFFLFVALLFGGTTQLVTRRTVSLALVVPTLTLGVAMTMRSHGLFYTSFATAPVESFVAIAITEVGPWYWVILVYDWGAIVLGTAVLVFTAMNRSRFYRYQLAVLLVAVLISWAANILYAVFSWPHPVLDPTALGFALSNVLLAVGIFRTQMIDVAPTARSLILDAIDDAVIVVDRANRVVDINDAARPLVDSDPAIGEPVTDALPTEVVQPETSDTATIELTANSRQRYFRHRQLPVGPDGADGKVIVLTDVTSEVTSRQQLQRTNQELETLNTRFELALEETDTGVWEWDLDTDEVIWDDASEQLYGYDPGEFPGTFEAFTDRVHDEDLPAVRDAIESAIETGNEYRADFQLTPDDGRQRWLQVRGVVEYDESGEPTRMIGIQTDITDQKQRERAVEQAREELRQIIDLIPDPLFVKNQDDEVLLSNEANAELLGSTPDEIEGKPEPEIMPDVENYDQYRQRDLEVIETGKSITFEEELTDPDGERHVFRTTRIPFSTAGSDEDAVLGYARDVTSLKEYEQELEATKDRLKQTNEELETLNRILRHDIRNDAVVQSRLGERLRAHVGEEGDEYLDQLLARGEHIADITTGMRDLMQTMLDDQRDLSAIRLDTILEAETENVTAAYEDAIVRLSGEIPQVSVQADQMLSSVFQNLLENAIQHNDADIPAVTVLAEERDDEVVVRIADNGPGVPADVADELFGKGEKGLESKGTGIGLYLVTKLLDKYEGDIWVEDSTAQEVLRADGDRDSHDIPDPDGEWNETVDGAVFAVELRKARSSVN